MEGQWRRVNYSLQDCFEGFPPKFDFIRSMATCSLLGGMGDGGKEGVVLDLGGGGELISRDFGGDIISSVSSALPKDPSSMLACEMQNALYKLWWLKSASLGILGVPPLCFSGLDRVRVLQSPRSFGYSAIFMGSLKKCIQAVYTWSFSFSFTQYSSLTWHTPSHHEYCPHWAFQCESPWSLTCQKSLPSPLPQRLWDNEHLQFSIIFSTVH